MKELTAELRRIDRTLEERTAFLHRISLAKEVYASLLPDNLQAAGRYDWECMIEYSINSNGIFTHQLADILESGVAPYAIFNHYIEELKVVAEYIAYGNKELESNLPEAILTAANNRVIKVITNHILNNL